jgi:uncharacterized protein (TIGR02600 family)
MKIHPIQSPTPLRRTKSGVALISVLAVIVLVTALIIGFLTRASYEGASSKNYRTVSTNNVLADTVVNLVQAEINEATSWQDTAWASQPGAVRVFDNSGGLTKYYRLYSAPSLVADTTQSNMQTLLSNDLPPADWYTKKALWVDLNAPVKVTGVTDNNGNLAKDYLVFPIVDPRDPNDLENGNYDINKDVKASLATSGSYGNPDNAPGMPGFSIDTNRNPVDPSNLQQPLPMPVRWLYVLENGSIVAPTNTGNSNIVTVNGADVSPIVGRIAFWTDDETTKVNINTAAGSFSQRGPSNGNVVRPAPWTTPLFKTKEDFKIFAQAQPVKGEYQRYPGHPATTDLYHIFKAIGIPMTDFPPVADPTAYTSAATKFPSSSSFQSSFFKLLPRYEDSYSSLGGTADTTRQGSSSAVQTTGTKTARLYSSVGELMFRSGTDVLTSGSRSYNWTGTNGNADPNMRQRIESGKFFLTAHSNAPETNLFGSPRVTIWPIPDDSSQRSSYDNLIAFCSTANQQNNYYYYFTRKNSNSETDDFDIERNKTLYNYLVKLTSQQIPGFGGSFRNKYNFSGGLECEQILTEIVDYVRCTNLYDYSSFTSGSAAAAARSFNTTGQAVPLLNTTNQTRGLGRVLTLSEIGLLVICTAQGSQTAHNIVDSSGNLAGSGTSYLDPVSVGGGLVSPMVGSANDPYYVSNLPEPQYLRDDSKRIVGLSYRTNSTDVNLLTIATGGINTLPPGSQPFPANSTLASSYTQPYVSSTNYPVNDSRRRFALNPGEKRLQAAILLEVAAPMMGYDLILNQAKVRIDHLANLFFSGINPFYGLSGTNAELSLNSTRIDGFSRYGGLYGIRYPAMASLATKNLTNYNSRYNGWSGILPDSLSANADVGLAGPPPYGNDNNNTPAPTGKKTKGAAYPYVSNPFTLTAGAPLIIDGNFDVHLIGTSGSSYGQTTPQAEYQVIQARFPVVTLATPDLMLTGVSPQMPFSWWGFDYRINNASGVPTSTSIAIKQDNRTQTGNYPQISSASIIRSENSVPASWNYAYVTTGNFPFPYSDNPSQPARSDVVRSIVAKDGDYRISAAKRTVVVTDSSGTGSFTTSPQYDNMNIKLANLFRDQYSQTPGYPGSDLGGTLVWSDTKNYVSKVVNDSFYVPKIPGRSYLMHRDCTETWDWDNGLPFEPDGAYANKPDEGNNYVNNATPYYNQESVNTNLITRTSYFTANRIIPSPVMFGSLPTGVIEGIPWRTLLFRPQLDRPSYANPPGPKDYLLLDLFHMPVVEPYAISEPFSTSGKINMNYQIVPFTYITRSTGVRAVLGSELVARIHGNAALPLSNNKVNYYKGNPQWDGNMTPPGGSESTRLPLNLSDANGSLRQFKEKFDRGEIFKSASEICDIFLVPRDPSNQTLYTNWTSDTAANQAWYGADFALVGDNSRERPYANIYPRLTTKSNTYTVHYYVQSLKNTNSDPTRWDESRGAILGEYRGSTTIERFIDPANSLIPNYAEEDPTSWQPLDHYYQWRVIANNSFAP